MVSPLKRQQADHVEHGITGDVLSAMDHLALTDLGITSLGHRLNLLRAVWELKRIQRLEMGEDEWTPQGGSHQTGVSLADRVDVPEYSAQKANDQVDKLWDIVLEQRPSQVPLISSVS